MYKVILQHVTRKIHSLIYSLWILTPVMFVCLLFFSNSLCMSANASVLVVFKLKKVYVPE